MFFCFKSAVHLLFESCSSCRSLYIKMDLIEWKNTNINTKDSFWIKETWEGQLSLEELWLRWASGKYEGQWVMWRGQKGIDWSLLHRPQNPMMSEENRRKYFFISWIICGIYCFCGNRTKWENKTSLLGGPGRWWWQGFVARGEKSLFSFSCFQTFNNRRSWKYAASELLWLSLCLNSSSSLKRKNVWFLQYIPKFFR